MSDLLPPAPHELYAYEPPVSLWKLIQAYVAEHEWEEVKIVLGESLVEQTLELQQEVETLLEIWRDYRCETDGKLMYHRLPEPPATRQRLKQEIAFFLQSIKEKSEDNGSNVAEILLKHDKNVLDYVLDKNTESRPSTARSSRDGRDTPMKLTPDRLLETDSVRLEVDSMQDQLNYLKMENVVQHLRDTLEKEIEQLLQDIDFLQQCLDTEADYRESPSISREPTLSDLREERSRLEKTLLSDEPTVPVVLRGNVPTPVKSPVLLSSPIVPRGRPLPLNKVHYPQPGPLKATRPISTQVLPSPTQNPTDRTTPSPDLAFSHHTSARSPVSSANSGSPSRTRRLSHPKTFLDQTTHVTIRNVLPQNARVVSVGSIPVSAGTGTLHAPSPPTSAKPTGTRPGSANRFRKMVLQCRDGQ